jgi:arylsulfatase A-like enzyme
VPHVAQAPTHQEDLSTKPSCQQSYADTWGKIVAPQPWIETHLKFYYQVQATVDEQITLVLDALRASNAYENTIVVFSSDHGDLQGAHGGMHEKWHCAYEEALHVPFVVSSPLLPGGARELDIPTRHADLIPTLLGLAGIHHAEALTSLRVDHTDVRPLVGRDLCDAIRAAEPAVASEPILSRPTTRSARTAHRSALSSASPGSWTSTQRSSSPTTSRPSSPWSTLMASSTS